MAKKTAKKDRTTSFLLPDELYTRLIRQAAKESSDRGRRVTTSQIIRWAIEDYLDQWETATFVPETTQNEE